MRIAFQVIYLCYYYYFLTCPSRTKALLRVAQGSYNIKCIDLLYYILSNYIPLISIFFHSVGTEHTLDPNENCRQSVGSCSGYQRELSSEIDNIQTYIMWLGNEVLVHKKEDFGYPTHACSLSLAPKTARERQKGKELHSVANRGQVVQRKDFNGV